SGVPVLTVSSPIDWDELNRSLEENNIDRIFLAGFMKIVPAKFVSKWEKKILNVHPSLLPAYPGLKSIEKAFKDGAPVGVTVHEVTAEMDAGPLVRQKRIETMPGLDFAATEFLVHVAEHRLVRESVRTCRREAI
ncbi:MAG: formyltransferase family protein, partial [Bdellovibrionia bacterium]